MRTTHGAAIAIVSTLLVIAPDVRAFCRAHTCDVRSSSCSVNARGCVTDGYALFWQDGRASFTIDSRGSVLRQITGDQALAALARALDSWMGASCAGEEHPNLA